MPARLALATLVVADYDAAISWFVDRLGFTLAEDRAAGEGKRFVVVVPPAGGAGLLLARAADGVERRALGAQAGGRVAFFLETDDFARDHAAMTEKGVRFLEAPRREGYGTVAVFLDIAGNRWDLIERSGR